LAEKCFLLISGHVFITRKWDIPPYLILLFDPKDKQNRKTKWSSATLEISFFSNVGKVKAKLDSIGLDLESLRNAMRKPSLAGSEVIDSILPAFLDNKRHLQAFLQWQERESNSLPEEIGFLLEDLDEDFRYSPIGHLFLVRLLCEYLDPQTEIILDPSEILQACDYDSSKVDIHDKLLTDFADELEINSLFSQLLVFSPDDMTLLSILHELGESDLINHVLVPVLDAMGFRPVMPTKFHGPGELGKDIAPFFKENEFGFREYYAIQAKTVKIHARAGKKGNVNEVMDQARTALSTAFFDPTDNSRKKIDHLLIVTSQSITRDARLQIEETIEKKREIMFVDDNMLVKLLKQHTQILRQVILRFSSRLRRT